MNVDLDESYLQFCKTQNHRDLLLAFIKYGSATRAAAALGRDRRGIDRIIGLIRTRAQLMGYSPEHDATHPTMPTEILRGRSTLYDGKGNLRQQWVKTQANDAAVLESMRVAAEAFREELPRYKPVKGPRGHLDQDLHNVYVITDYHFGMLSWAEETGADWDVSIAERTLLRWFEQAIASAPDAETATFAQLGDFLHFDGFDAVTPASKNLLDVDTRFQRVVRIVIRCLRQVIDMLLAKHKHLTVIMADANHDPASGIWLREWLAHVYENDPRVTVDNSADTYYCYTFGKTFLAYHHGHKRGPKDIDSVVVSKFREKYGATEHHYCHTGHLHHDRERETNLLKIVQHRTLAAPDAYASRQGFMSGRDAKVEVYHREYGHVGRVIINYDMIAL